MTNDERILKMYLPIVYNYYLLDIFSYLFLKMISNLLLFVEMNNEFHNLPQRHISMGNSHNTRQSIKL